MFKKLVSNLPFSPGLVSQMGFYIKRLRQEEFIRRMGMIFTAMSIAVQLVSVAVPPTHAQSSHANNIVREGLTSKAHLLKVYDQGDTGGHEDIDEIFNYFGIGRKNIENMRVTSIKSNSLFDGSEAWTMGRHSYGFARETSVYIPARNTTLYLRPWAASWGTYDSQVLLGNRSDGTQFAVIMNCGNLVIAFAEEEPKPVDGEFTTTCDAVSGWATDPRNNSYSVKVQINIDGQKVHSMLAENDNEFIANFAGHHGFRWNIPDSYVDGSAHTVAVTAFEDVGARGGVSEGNKLLPAHQGKNVIPANCYEPPEDTIQVCRPGAGIITIGLSEVKETDHEDLTMCSEIQICVNDQLIAIEKWEYSGEPTACPQIEVCRDGVIQLIASNTRTDTDLDASECEEIHVCDGDAITTIAKSEYDPDTHVLPQLDDLGALICGDPAAQINKSKVAKNVTRAGAETVATSAKPGDVIRYELTTINSGNADTTEPIDENLSDVLEYSTLVDFGGGDFNGDTKTLSWGNVDIAAGTDVTHAFKVKIKDVLPATATNPGNPASYDFNMNNVYGNAVNIKLPKPISKQVEQFASSLPETGPGENAFFAGLFATLVFFFYFRNRLVTKELNMLRKDFRGDA